MQTFSAALEKGCMYVADINASINKQTVGKVQDSLLLPPVCGLIVWQFGYSVRSSRELDNSSVALIP